MRDTRNELADACDRASKEIYELTRRVALLQSLANRLLSVVGCVAREDRGTTEMAKDLLEDMAREGACNDL